MERLRWREVPMLPNEALDLLKRPEQVFDSSLKLAEKESLFVVETMSRRGRIEEIIRDAEIVIEEGPKSQLPPIQIAWPLDHNHAMLLQLEPFKGKSLEVKLFGYSGGYGVAEKEKDVWKLQNSCSLEDLFAAPSGVRFIVMPTIDRWAVGKDDYSIIHGKNAVTLYMGLGLLFLGQEWMIVGMHESGHLPDIDGENQAWHRALVAYAKRHRSYKNDIINGRYNGLFDLLKKPKGWHPRPTIGQIMKYGLVSHGLDLNTHIPKAWLKNTDETMRELQRIINDAQEVFGRVMGT